MKSMYFSCKSFGVSNKSYTFASAFENEQMLDKSEHRFEQGGAKERVLWKDLHKDRSSTRSENDETLILG